MSNSDARAIIQVIRDEVESATDALLSGAERALRDVAAARAGDAGALDRLESTLCAMLEACAFQDLTGQRLSKLDGMVANGTLAEAPDDPLLNGPALPGQGLDQAAVDQAF